MFVVYDHKPYEPLLTKIGPQLKKQATKEKKIDCNVLIVDVACLAHRLANLVGSPIVDCTAEQLDGKLANIAQHSAAILKPFFESIRSVTQNKTNHKR